MKPKISLVIPVFNGEKFLAETLDSLINQTLKEFELICINDASTDGSLDILNQYTQWINLKIIDLKTNVGLVPLIIKEHGISNIQGEYYMYMSQDDLLSPDCLEKMYQVATDKKADAVIPDFVYYSNANSDIKIIGVKGNRDVTLSGKDAFALSLSWEIPGNAIWRIDLVKSIGYEIFNMYADEYTIRKFFLASNVIAFSEGTFYYRIDNPNAITRKMKPALFSKLFKEVKVLELVHQYCSSEIFVKRAESLLTMIFSYQSLLYMQKFNKQEKDTAQSHVKLAIERFNDFFSKSRISMKTSNYQFLFKYLIIRSGYNLFYLINWMKSCNKQKSKNY